MALDACLGSFLHELLKCIQEAEDADLVLSLLKFSSSLLYLNPSEHHNGGQPSANSVPQHVLEMAVRCKSAVASDPSASFAEAIRRSFYHPSRFKAFAIALLYKVAPDWRACFSAKDAAVFFDSFFLAAPATTALEILLPIAAAPLSREGSSEVEEIAAAHAERLLAARLLGKEEEGSKQPGRSTEEGVTGGFSPMSGVKELALGWWWDRSDGVVNTMLTPVRIAGLLASVPDGVRPQAPACLRAPHFVVLLVKELLAAVVVDAGREARYVRRPPARASRAQCSESESSSREELVQAHVTEEDERRWTFVVEVFTRLCRRGHAGIVASSLIDTFFLESDADSDASRFGRHDDMAKMRARIGNRGSDLAAGAMWRKLVALMSDHVAIERLAEALLRGMAGRRVRDAQAVMLLQTLFGPLLHTSCLLRDIFLDRLLLRVLLPMPCVRWLVELAESSASSAGNGAQALPHAPGIDAARNNCTAEDSGGGGGEGTAHMGSLLVEMMSCMLIAWASPEFVRAKSLDQQSYVSAALIMSVRKMSQERLDSTPHLISCFMKGTSIRLDSPLLPVRKMGQRVMEAFSLLLDPSKPLLFSDEEEDGGACGLHSGTWEGAWWERPLASTADGTGEGDATAGTEIEPGGGEEQSGEGEGTSGVREESTKREEERRKERRERRRRRRARLAVQEDDPDEVVDLGGGRAWEEERKREGDGDGLLDSFSDMDMEESASGMESDSGSVMSLEPYGDIVEEEDDEEEDSARRKAPIQLQNCLAALRNTKDHNAREKALGMIESLVRAAPDELEDLSAELARVLFHLNASDVAVEGEEEALEQKRHAALVALVVECTLPVINVLVPNVYSPHVNETQRVSVLDVLADAARELAWTPVEPTPSDRWPSARGLVEDVGLRKAWFGPGEGWATPGAGQWRESARPASSTALTNWAHKYERELPPLPGRREIGQSRRWGHSRLRGGDAGSGARPGPTTFKNRFAPVAAAFMLPLMRYYDRVSRGVDLLGRGFIVLGRLLSMLGVCMECCSNQPEAVPIAESLLDLLLTRSIASHEEPYVRRSALYAASRVLLALPPACFLVSLASDDKHGLTASLQHLHQYFANAASNDPDDECSKMAETCMYLYGETVTKAVGTLGTMPGASGLGATTPQIESSPARSGPLIQVL